jgi:L-asparaginase
MSDAQYEGVRYALERKIPVVITTRTGSGRIAAVSRRDGDTPIIAGEDLMPVKARVLLMLALTRTSDPADIQRMFLQY